MAEKRYLVDTSAMSRVHHETVRARLEPLMTRALVHSCGILDLEALYSARSPADYQELTTFRESIFLPEATNEEDFERALNVQAELASSSRHRVALPDLIIAAVAERSGLTILHYDHEFEIISSVTGQDQEWVVPRGTV